MERNPNHPVTKAVHAEWHKFAVLLMVKFGKDHVVLSMADIEKLVERRGGVNITVRELPDGIHLRLVNDKEAARLAGEHGGLPPSGN